MRNSNGNETVLFEPVSRLNPPRIFCLPEERRGARFDRYDTGGFYDEMFVREGEPRAIARRFVASMESLPEGEVLNRQQAADRDLPRMGLSFNVCGERDGMEKALPLDIVPRMIGADEWRRIERGLEQRISALNLFINDIYHEQMILKDRVIPREIIYSSKSYRRQCAGWNPPRAIWCHLTATDLVRHEDGQLYVLEDNLRSPSGVSHVLENRRVMKDLFPEVFSHSRIQPVSNYPSCLRNILEYLAGDEVAEPRVVLLTPGLHSSAYFEHAFLAQQMGIELVEEHDLIVEHGVARMRTAEGFERVDVIYRQMDDSFLDAKCAREDSLLETPGLMEACKAGNVALANAPGCGVADDKVVYAYLPRMIQYYLGEEILLPNVPTRICADKDDLQYVLEHLDELVVKAVNKSGGQGMLVGPHSTREQRSAFAEKIKANPRNYMAQPTLALSRVPTILGDRLEGRHVDLRLYVLYGKDIYVLPGGLTRVALKKGSLVVNSSQGGGSKDTWVLADAPVAGQPESWSVPARPALELDEAAC
jgi:uncharacterized circularly permuted ATP-grasp superfamily protein